MSELSEEQVRDIKDLRQYTKNVFSSKEGRIVFKWLLSRLLVFNDDIAGPEQTALSNVGWELMEMAGCIDPEVTKEAIINAVLDTPAQI